MPYGRSWVTSEIHGVVEPFLEITAVDDYQFCHKESL